MKYCCGTHINKEQRRKADERRSAISLAQDAQLRANSKEEKQLADITAAALAATANYRKNSNTTTLGEVKETIPPESTTASSIQTEQACNHLKD